MPNHIEKKLSLLIAAGFTAFSLTGCMNTAPHGGLVPDISGPTTVDAGTPANYDLSASSVTDYALSFSINWGDGTKPLIVTNSSHDGASGDHVWSKPGTYTLTGTATDGHGDSGFSTYIVQVNAPPPQEPSSPQEPATAPPETLSKVESPKVETPAPAPEPPSPPQVDSKTPASPAPPLTVFYSTDPSPMQINRAPEPADSSTSSPEPASKTPADSAPPPEPVSSPKPVLQ
jgi:hypothetical protein